jgi:proteasome lid subunit RPN8/RPN11
VAKIKLSRQAVKFLMSDAQRGYEELYKREVGGHLLGYRLGKEFYVSKVIPYHTPLRTRSEWSPNTPNFERKGLKLETRRLKWIGTYHSHVEIGGSASTGQSPEDIESHLSSLCPIEIIIRIANCRLNSPKNCLSYFEIFEEGLTYFYDICGYLKDSTGEIRRVSVKERRLIPPLVFP